MKSNQEIYSEEKTPQRVTILQSQIEKVEILLLRTLELHADITFMRARLEGPTIDDSPENTEEPMSGDLRKLDYLLQRIDVNLGRIHQEFNNLSKLV